MWLRKSALDTTCLIITCSDIAVCAGAAVALTPWSMQVPLPQLLCLLRYGRALDLRQAVCCIGHAHASVSFLLEREP